MKPTYEELQAQVEVLKDWRRLALQFDGQRMMAMSFLKGITEGNYDQKEIRAFLAEAPKSGNEHLRDIQADAGRAGYYNGFKDALVIDPPLPPATGTYATVDVFQYRVEQASRYAASQYAERIRQGGEELRQKLDAEEDRTKQQSNEFKSKLELIRCLGLRVVRQCKGDSYTPEVEALDDALYSTPAACLAQVKAGAVMDFVSFVYEQFETGKYHHIARLKHHFLNTRAQGQTVSVHNDGEYCGILGNAEVYVDRLTKQQGGE
jgi:hypothetical protein